MLNGGTARGLRGRPGLYGAVLEAPSNALLLAVVEERRRLVRTRLCGPLLWYAGAQVAR